MHDELTAPAIMAPPDPARAVVVRPAAGSGGQTWVGSPSAVRAGEWDGRGARVTAVRFNGEGIMAFYDGRASATQNCEERTGVAAGTGPEALTALGTSSVAESSDPGYGLRYVTVVDLGDGSEIGRASCR